MNPARFFTIISVLLSTFLAPGLRAAEVFELSAANFEERPGGKEADGIVGDFVLRNDTVELLISGDLPLRRPNMSAYYGEGNHTPGCLYDLTLRDADNDQITIFTPSVQRGDVSYVRIDESVEDGTVGVETVVSAATGGGISKRHQYLLKDGWQGVLILTTIKNESEAEQKISLKDSWTQMRSKGSFKGILWADAINPADKCGYACGWVEEGGAALPKSEEPTIRPGETIQVARFLAVGISPAEAVGVVAARRKTAPQGSVVVTITDSNGKPATGARVALKLEEQNLLYAYPDEKGVAIFDYPAGEHQFSIEDIGRETLTVPAIVKVGETLALPVTVSAQARVLFTITGDDGGDTPCKVQFHPRKGTAALDLGPTDRAHGCVDQWFSETGQFEVPLPAGEYRIVVSRGPEHDSITQDITLGPGAEAVFKGQLKRAVSTPGWVSTDLHSHSTPSGDNTCGTADRLINLAAEQLEFAPTTEHNRLYDWEPIIEKTGLSPFLKTVPGMELTGSGAHFNSFPLKPDPMKQDGGAPVWQKDPRLNAIVLRDYQGAERDRWIHVNHPDMSENFVDRDGDGRADGGYAYFGKLIDGLEAQNYSGSSILAGAPFKIATAKTGLGKSVLHNREFIWLQLLNQGLRVWGIGVSDAHHVYGNGVGSWRTYVPSDTDDPAKIDWREISRNAKAGRMILSSGPYLEVKTASGAIAGGFDRVTGELEIDVRVQCPNWLDIDRVQVLVNGRQDPRYNYTRADNADMFGDGVMKFDHRLTLDLSEDAHIIVVAIGEKSSLIGGFGTSAQSAIQPCAYNNPIFIDVNGNGFEPNRDTLGFELPVKKLSVETVEKMLAQ
jgi:hypothetical protein